MYIISSFSEFLENLENWSYDVKPYLNKFEKSKNKETIGKYFECSF